MTSDATSWTRDVAASLSLAALCFTLGCGGADTDTRPPPMEADRATVLRDEYGVPHIFAGSREAAAFAWGFVQAEDQRERILMYLYAGEARAAEVFGHDCDERDCAGVDLEARTFEIPETVAAGYPELEADTRDVLEAYAAGVNHFFEQLDPPMPYFVRPVTAQSVVGTMMLMRLDHAIRRSLVFMTAAEGSEGSNQFAVTGAHTAEATTIVSADPHTPWGPIQPSIHVHYDDFDIVGSSVTFPAIHCGGNNFVSWGCSTLRSTTTVSVEVELSNDGNSYFDHAAGPGGGFVEFGRRSVHVDVAGKPGGIDVEVLDTRFGPVVAVEGGYAYTAHVFSAADVGIADYLIGMWQTRGADDYLALFAGPTSGETSSNRTFGTRDHRIGYVYGSYVPMLDEALDWSLPVSSADPRIEWAPERWYNLDGSAPELPYLLDPLGDFVQNSNGHPAWSTEPPGQIPTDIPAILNAGNGPSPRGRRLAELLSGANGIDVVDAMVISMDVKVTKAEPSGEALRRGLDAAGIDPASRWGDDVAELISILLGWRDASGYEATADSEAMTVYYHLDRAAGGLDGVPPGTTLPVEILDELAAGLTVVAADMRGFYGATFPDPLHVPWGWVNHAVVGGRDIAMSGGTMALPTLFMAWGELGADGRMDTAKGSHYMQVGCYGPDGFEVYLSVPNGQVNESLFPDSPHVGQTIDDFVARIYRRVWLSREEVEAHLCPYAATPGHEHAARTELRLPIEGSE